MPTIEEKNAFAQRLKQALKRSPKKISTPTELALNFNLHHLGDPITPQSAQKWLAGATRPTLDKIVTLSEFLNVSTQWLRYGIAEDRPTVTRTRKSYKAKPVHAGPPTPEELKLLATLRAMPEHRRGLVLEIVEQFSLEQEMWRD